MAVLLERLSGQEMLQEIHSRAPYIRANVHVVVAALERPAQAKPLAVGLAKCFGIEVLSIESGIGVGVLPDDKSRCLLVEVADAQCGRDGIFAGSPRRLGETLELAEAGIAAETAVVRCRAADYNGCSVGIASEPFNTDEIVRPHLEAALRGIRASGLGQQDTDRAMQRIRAVERIAGAPNHFDSLGEFGRQLEQLVDIAEAAGPRGYAVFERQERAAGTGPGQHRRTNRRQALLAAAACHPDAGNAGQQFMNVCMIRGFDLGSIQHIDVAGMRCER